MYNDLGVLKKSRLKLLSSGPDRNPAEMVIQNILFVRHPTQELFDPGKARYYPANSSSKKSFEDMRYYPALDKYRKQGGQISPNTYLNF